MRLATQKATAPNAKHININQRVREETINNLEINYNDYKDPNAVIRPSECSLNALLLIRTWILRKLG